MKDWFVWVSIAALVISAGAVETITSEDLAEISSSRRLWLVYEAAELSPEQGGVLHNTAEILTGFYKVAHLSTGEEQVLRFYADDGEVKVYEGPFETHEIVKWTLENTQVVLDSRSKVAKQVKANKEFQAREVERANQEWEQEQQLRAKSDVLVVNTQNWEVFLRQRNPVLLNVYEANCSACIDTNKEWEAVATALKGQVKVIKINITDSEELEQWVQVQNYPSIRYYTAGNKKVEEFNTFTGTMKKFSILEWVNSKLKQKSTSIDLPELNSQNYKELCKTTKSTCVILFSEDPDETAGRVAELAAKYLEKPINFLVSKKGSQPKFEEQIEVTSFPHTVMMYCKMKKMLKLDGINLSEVDDIINEITMGNRNNFVKYKFDEDLS